MTDVELASTAKAKALELADQMNRLFKSDLMVEIQFSCGPDGWSLSRFRVLKPLQIDQ